MSAVDRRSDRWQTALHEAGHVEVGKRLGATSLSAWLDDDRSGYFVGRFDGPDEDEAVILLAGAAAAGRRGGGATDRREAKRLLRGTGVSMGEAERRARRAVSGRRGAIERTAQRLYRRGRT